MKMQCVLVARLCPTLCDTRDCGQLGSFVRGILQAEVLEWVAISSSRGFSRPKGRTQVSCFGGQRGFFSSEPPGNPQGYYAKTNKPITIEDKISETSNIN